MRRTSAKFVPRLLTDDSKQRRAFVRQELLDEVGKDQNLMSMVVTGDDICVYCYDQKTKQQSCEWKSPRSPHPNKARQVRWKIKSM